MLNKICKIASSPTEDISKNKGSLEDVHLWDYLLPNYGAKNGISILDAYKREELANKLVIQIVLVINVQEVLLAMVFLMWEEFLHDRHESSKVDHQNLLQEHLNIHPHQIPEFLLCQIGCWVVHMPG